MTPVFTCCISVPILPCTSASSASVEALTSCSLQSDHLQIRRPQCHRISNYLEGHCLILGYWNMAQLEALYTSLRLLR